MGTLTMVKELAQDKTTADLEKAAWFKDAFSDMGLDQSKKAKQPAPGKWSVKSGSRMGLANQKRRTSKAECWSRQFLLLISVL